MLLPEVSYNGTSAATVDVTSEAAAEKALAHIGRLATFAGCAARVRGALRPAKPTAALDAVESASLMLTGRQRPVVLQKD